MITAHGWFSYEICVVPDSKNIITVEAGSNTDLLCMRVIIGEIEHNVNIHSGEKQALTFEYTARPDEHCVRIRFEKISAGVPCIYTVKVK